MDLTPYRLPISPVSPAGRRVLDRGVVARSFPRVEHAYSVLVEKRVAWSDGVYRSPEGTALVLCTTDMPGVTPGMIDWWFGWHLPESERYKLWHPKAHLKAVVKEDRSHLRDDRARYVGNVSYVDEYIGRQLTRLAIAFQTPASFDLPDIYVQGSTAICARTTDRAMRSEGGALVHLIVPTSTGCEMRSGFWLGEIKSELPIVGPYIDRLVNRASVRTKLIPNRFVLDLYEHCSEEMTHLQKFLPTLYRDVHGQVGREVTA